MTERVSREYAEEVLDDCANLDAAINSLEAQRVYIAGGKRRDHSELPDFEGPDAELYEGVSREELEEFNEALSTIKAGIREEDSDGCPLILNEEAMYDQIVSGSLEFYAPWNVGMDQESQEIRETVDYLQKFAEMLDQETVLDAEVTVYTLEAYARNNDNSFQQTKDEVRKAVRPKEDVSMLEWSEFECQVLGQELDERLGYDGLRNRESDLMSGEVRISPAENPGQEDKEYVDEGGNPKSNEAVIYGPFIGPWKSGYDEEIKEVPELLDEMRSVT